LMHGDPVLSRSVDLFGNVGFNRLARVLATLLELPGEAIQQALSREGRLIACGVLDIGFQPGLQLDHILNFNSRDLLNQLRFRRGAALDLFKHSFRRGRLAVLELSDYQHLGDRVQTTLSYLRKVMARERQGVNILIYGPPGTGKTELCRLLAETLGVDLFEIACTDSDGDPITGNQRLSALSSA